MSLVYYRYFLRFNMLAARNRIKHFIDVNKLLSSVSSAKFICMRPLSTPPPLLFTTLIKKIPHREEKDVNYVPFKPPTDFNFARDILDQWAEADKNNAAKGIKEPLAFWYVTSSGSKFQWTYTKFSKESQRAANALIELGANKNWNRCLLLLPKVPEWWTINIACVRLGVVLITSSTMATPMDIQYRLQTSKAPCVITNPRLADVIDSVQDSCPLLQTKIVVSDEPNSSTNWMDFQTAYNKASAEHVCVATKSSDPLQIFFTSGTTSMPKRVVHSHANLGLGFFYWGRYILLLNRNVVFWNMADTGWAKTAWSSLFTPLLHGATIFVHEMPRFNPEETIETLEKYPIDLMCAPPTVYRMLLAKRVPKLKTRFFSAGEPLNAETVKKWEEATGVTIRQGYGQTETPPLVGCHGDEPVKLGSTGKAVIHPEVKIVDDNYLPVPTGVIGHIAVVVKPERPLGLFLEYEDEPEKTLKCMIGDCYITGDKGHVDEEGNFWFHSRADDVITSSGYRIGPFEVESALLGHPDVLESAVVGSPDPIRGDVVKAFVVLNESGKERNPDNLIGELQEHVRKITAPYKYPRKIEFVDDLPKTISGKTKRAELRQREIDNMKKNTN